MKLLATLAILASPLALTSAQAEVSSLVAFDKQTRSIIAAGDLQQGKVKAAAMKCNKCHAENGQGDDDVSVAGHPDSYIYKQLKDFKDKKRDGIMRKKVRKLSDKDMADFAVWYASLPFAKGEQGGGQLAIDLVYKGDSKRMLKPCSTCHGQNGEGGKYDSPAIMGQNKEAFITMMEEFKDAERTNDIYSRMRLIAKVLSAKEIQALADYYGVVEQE